MNFSQKKSLNNIVWSPSKYAETSVLAKEVGHEMLARLEWMILQPKIILDVGCGTGIMASELQKRYKKARVIAIDNAETMLHYAREKYVLSPLPWVCALGEKLPLPDQTVDLIYANFMLPWHMDFTQLLREWRRILRPDGLLMFTALGPDTLQEWRTIFSDDEIPQLIDVHDLGDNLLEQGFADPVLDVSSYTLTYRDRNHLLEELAASGMLFPEDFSLIKKSLASVSPTADGAWATTYEIIYAHAFGPASNEFSSASDGTVKIPLSHLRRQLDK